MPLGESTAVAQLTDILQMEQFATQELKAKHLQ